MAGGGQRVCRMKHLEASEVGTFNIFVCYLSTLKLNCIVTPLFGYVVTIKPSVGETLGPVHTV